MAMTITPFPPRELAKLVLGYLAEEQLMTAYDEFLQSSPYLDALENEHDRVFMTPLRNIVAEYRALKIYVETCKPFALRRRLMGCANLLEAVKLLVLLVDGKTSSPEHAAGRLGHDSGITKTYSRIKRVCDVCSSLRRTSCACHVLSKSNTSVEATLLQDLPGHHGRKKHVKVLDKDKTLSSNEQFQLSVSNPEESSSGSLDEDVVIVDSQDVRPDNNCNADGQSRNSHSVREVANASQKTDVIHKTLSNVSNSSQYKGCKSSIRGDLHSPAAGSFQGLAAGVEGKNTVPDSSTSESLNPVIPVATEDSVPKEASDNDSDSGNKKGVTKAHILLKVSNHTTSTASQSSAESPSVTTAGLKQTHSLRLKPNDQKITILSDIKVDNAFPPSSPPLPPLVLRHAAPPRTLHTLFINGAPAYTRAPHAPHAPHAQTAPYTRDEIMAMRTIIVMPVTSAAGQPYKIHNYSGHPPNNETIGAPNNVSSKTHSLEPLVIDVENTAVYTAKPDKQSDMSQNKNMQSESDPLSAKTGEFKNATVPKDAEPSNKSTPVSAPLPRKSSSTPRRSGHVRVLDFTTPRRILSEPLAEHSDATSTQHRPLEVVPTDIPSFPVANPKDTKDSDKNTVLKLYSVNKSDECAIATQSIQKIITVKKSDWDADLRALAVANATMETPKQKGKSDTPRVKAKSAKRKKGSENKRDVEKSQEKKKSKRKSNVTKSTSKIQFKSLEVIEDTVEIVDLSPPPGAVKPTINIITKHEWGTVPAPEDSDKNKPHEEDKNKPHEEDENDTPEMERLSLQNAIGAKLNISDLLETPYKQVLYDIQMETPRFLGPDLPGDPMSDIKIMNIPTPRFLATPKPPQATPSSYSSRPTDYSSSSSYYKPDDHDCIDIGYPVLSPKETPPESNEVCKNDKIFKSSRPVRKCTKNVSYVNSPNIKAKESDKDDASVNSEVDLSESRQLSKNLKSKTPKAETKRKSVGIKKRKTPVKKEAPKSFMKIKPRRPTPVKDSGRKTKQSVTPGRKKTVSRDNVVSITLAVASTSVPTKSRRKSSTPRKLHCTKQFHSESSGHESPEMVEEKSVPTRASSASGDQPPLHWSDEGTQDSAPTDSQSKPTESHSKPTESHSKPTESHSKPTDSHSKPTDSHTELTDSHSKPTDSHTELTDSHSKPTDSHTEPTDSHSKPADSHTELTDELTNSQTKPTDSNTQLTYSHTKPTDIHTKLTDSYTKPTDSHTKPTDSHTKRTYSHSKLTDSHSKPTGSNNKPTESHTKLTDSHTKRTDSHTKPTGSPTKPTDSHTKLTDFRTKHTDSRSKPTDSRTKPTDSRSKPTDSRTKPTDSRTKSTDSHPKPTDTHTKPTDSHTKLTDSHTKPTDSHTKPTDNHTKHKDTHTKHKDTHTKSADTHNKSPDSHIKPTEEIQNAISTKSRLGSINDTEDITKIRDYLAKSEPDQFIKVPEGMENHFHIDLVRRGFDMETAKIIERDLLDTPPHPKDNLATTNEEPLIVEASKYNNVEKSTREREESISNSFVDVEGNDDEDDEVEFSVHECNEHSENYIVCHHDDIKDIPRKAPEKLKDKYSVEVCIDDDVAIRLRATPLTFLIDEDPKDQERLEYNRETEMAVSSISGMPKLYTPLKDQRAQCYEIFDSTLTSLDTPMKLDTPKRRDREMTVTEIVLEVENVDVKDKVETKRKRALSGNTSDESTNENKKSKPDPQYLLNPANIKNIDIETVLCKLHGP